MDRRDFLKFFGAGAAVVPLVGGMPHSGAIAQLVEPAKVEPFSPKVEAASAADLETLRSGTLRGCVQIHQHKPVPAVFGFSGGEFVIAATENEIDVTLMALNGVDLGGHWSTRTVHYSERPTDVEFTIKVSYRKWPQSELERKLGSTHARRVDKMNWRVL